MLLAEVHQLVDSVASFDEAVATLEETKASLEMVTRLRGWLESRSLSMVRRLRDLSSFPEHDIGAATRSSQRSAAKQMQRAQTAEGNPAIGDALAEGTVSPEHVDVLTRALAGLTPEARNRVGEAVGSLVLAAQRTTPEQFERVLRRHIETARLEDGETRLANQRAAARVRTWIDRATGMWHLHGEFDPETGLQLHAQIEAMLRSKFAQGTPAECPTNPAEKQDWLRAQALIALITGHAGETAEPGAGRTGAPETVVVVDTRDGTVQWGFDATLPSSALQRFIDRSKVHFVDLHDDDINWAPGQLNLGRTTRLANRAQRRALRALYATCGLPGCCVKYENTKLHHVVWWRNGGPTDIGNLLPTCSRHHTQAHDGTFTLQLGPNRALTIRWRDGRTMTTGPPQQDAA